MTPSRDDDGVELRPYIQSLIRYWWLIILTSILFIGIAWIYSTSKAKQYESTATLLITRSRPSPALAEQLPTVNEPVDARSRMDAILSIAKSDSIALETLSALGGEHLPQSMDKEALGKVVTVESRGDAVLVKAKVGNSALAAEIANQWARQIVTDINQAYSGNQPLEEIEKQAIISKKEYESAQTSLEEFIQQNKSKALEMKIEESQALINEIVKIRSKQYLDYSERKQNLDKLLLEAEALKNRLEESNQSSAGDVGDALAVLISRATGLVQNKNFTIDLSLNDLGLIRDTSTSYARDLESLIEAMHAEKNDIENILKYLAQPENGVEGIEDIDLLAEQIQSMKSQLEGQQAVEAELTSERDTAWNAFQALVQKEVELKNLAQAVNQVAMVSKAVPNERPVPQGSPIMLPIAGSLGFILAVFGILALHWWRHDPSST